MVLTKKNSAFNLIIYSALMICLAATPNFNKDALIIPKVVILFCSALALLPYLILNLNVNRNERQLNYFTVVSILFMIQVVLVLVVSSAPIEQQIFGRTGRGLGFITILSFITISLSCAYFIKPQDQRKLIMGITLSGVGSSIYAIFQSYGLDFFPWDSRTNGVIGTFGNPNFISSFAAMSLLPSLIFVSTKNRRIFYQIALVLLFMLTIVRAESTQGFINVGLAVATFILIFLWYKNKLFFSLTLTSVLFSTFLIVLGLLNQGPLSKILFKVSVRSRGEFWQSALNTANAHPIFGVGIDTFGDYSLMYREQAVVNEYTDSAHNYILDFAANGGFPLALLYILTIVLTLISFFHLQKKVGKFDSTVAALFSVFVVFQAQSLISPISIPLLIWGVIVNGSVIGLANSKIQKDSPIAKKIKVGSNPFSVLLVLIGLIIIFPYFNSDRLQLQAMNNADGDLAIKVAKMYPESVVRYSVLTRALLDSGLNLPALDLARSSIEFNTHSPALWVLILINPAATLEERNSAKLKLLSLDPLNQELINYEVK